MTITDGWKLVPLEPTDDMVANIRRRQLADRAAWGVEPIIDDKWVYRAMIAAAPDAPIPAERMEPRVGSIQRGTTYEDGWKAAIDAVLWELPTTPPEHTLHLLHRVREAEHIQPAPHQRGSDGEADYRERWRIVSLALRALVEAWDRDDPDAFTRVAIPNARKLLNEPLSSHRIGAKS